MLTGALIKNVPGDTGSYYPEHTTDDAFITAIGAYFGTTGSLPLQSGTTDVISGLRFQNLTIAQDAKINNATLFVRTMYEFDPVVNISVTIYGIAENDAYSFSGSGDFTRSYTLNYVNWNVTDVNGRGIWHNVSVTEIVQEVISRYGWRSGNSLAFLILCPEGEVRREFATIDQNIVYRPRLDITYDVEPADPSTGADPPYNDTDVWSWFWNRTYRGFDIWDVIYVNENRTGLEADVNWNTINMNLLSEHDNGAAIVRNNATWATATNFRKAYIGSIYNDTGSANINSYFLRWKVNVTEVYTVEAGNDLMPFVFALSTHSPTTTDGMAYGANGEWVGLIGVVNPDRAQWRISIRERDGGASDVATTTDWFSEDTPTMLYFEAYINMIGGPWPYLVYTIFTDPEFTNILVSKGHVFTIATGPFRYPQILAGDAQTTSGSAWYDTYTYLEFELPEFPPVIFITYPNGTLTNGPIEEDPKDYIDDILGGADPEDPETDFYGTALTKNRWKFFVFVIGMAMFLVTPAIGIMNRVGIGRWYLIMFVSLCGLALLWSLKYM